MNDAESLDDGSLASGLRARLHLAAALLHLALVPLSTSGATASYVLLAVTWAARLPTQRRDLQSLLRQPLVVVLIAWGTWATLSLLWSSDPEAGLDQLRALRMLLLPLLLWPLRRHAASWVIAVFLGVAIQNGTQLLQLAGVLALKHEHAGRIGGFAHPIHTGLWSAVVLCFYVPIFFRAQPRRLRALSAAGAALALCGLLVAQSRGPWIAAAVALPLEVWLVWPREGLRKHLGRTLGGAVAVLALALAAQGGAIVERVGSALQQANAVLDDGGCTSDVGLRICQWRWSAQALADAPIAGTGVGSFRERIAALPDFRETLARWPGQEHFLVRKHPHNAALNILGTQGAVGGLLFASGVALVLRTAWQRRRDAPLAIGTLCATTVWSVGALFDSYDLSGCALGVFALCASVACTFSEARPEEPRQALH